MSISKLIIIIILSAIAGAAVTYLVVKPKADAALISLVETDTALNAGAGLPIDIAKQMVAEYKRKTVAMLKDSSYADSLVRSVYFNLGPLSQYIEKVRASEPAVSGLRIYFANYYKTEEREVSDVTGQFWKKDLKGYNTLVIVPTKRVNGDIVDVVKDSGNGEVQAYYQSFNAGISCPPYPPAACKGEVLLQTAVKN